MLINCNGVHAPKNNFRPRRPCAGVDGRAPENRSRGHVVINSMRRVGSRYHYYARDRAVIAASDPSARRPGGSRETGAGAISAWQHCRIYPG